MLLLLLETLIKVIFFYSCNLLNIFADGEDTVCCLPLYMYVNLSSLCM